MLRRIPIYTLLDTSGHMRGDGMESARRAIAALITDMQSDPHALETVWLSVITFAESATQLVPLTELMSLTLPDLGSDCNAQCRLGEALHLLDQCLATEFRKTTESSKRDSKPLVFLFGNGVAEDSWEPALNEVR